MYHQGFVHSVKVPRLYKTAANIAETVKNKEGSLKNLLYKNKHEKIKALGALVLNTLHNYDVLEDILKNTQLLELEPRLDPWLARILITELLWGKTALPGCSKPVATVQKYEKKLRALGDVKQLDKKVILKPRYVRVNTLKGSVPEVVHSLTEEGFVNVAVPSTYEGFVERVRSLEYPQFIQDFNIPELLVFPPNDKFYDHRLTHAGVFSLQDKASCCVAHILSPEPGSTVLDMCAAPGLKTIHCAAFMKNRGKIYALDINENRMKVLREQARLAGATCIEPIVRDSITYTNDDVDLIIVDVPCTGSGMVSGISVQEPRFYDINRIQKLRWLQSKFLKHALNDFPSAKRVVYSTCSVYWQENEGVINDILKSGSASKFKLVDCEPFLSSFNSGLRKNARFKFSRMCCHMTFEHDLTNGFFVALFVRKSGSDETETSLEIKIEEKTEDEEEESISLKEQKEKKKNVPQNTKTGDLHTEVEGNNETVSTNKSRKRKKAVNVSENNETSEADEVNTTSQPEIKKKKKKKKVVQNIEIDESQTKKLKKKAQNWIVEECKLDVP